MLNEQFVVDLYIRVSTDQQAREGDSLEEQECELRKFCDYKGYTIHHVFIERGKSGGNTNRPEYQKLILDVKNKKINAVVVKKLDRLSRSLLDFEAFMKMLQDHNIEFISLRESFDTSSAMGKAMLRVALTFAQLEREQTSERLVDVFEYRASQGMHNGGLPPYGYTNLNKERVPVKKEKEVVELIFDRFLDTPSTTDIARYLNENEYRYRNNKLWDKRQIQKILQLPFYKGDIFWKGKIYAGNHQAIISPEKFEQVQALFRRRCPLPVTKSMAILQRLIFCGDCAVPMTPSHAINRHKVRYFYYRCVNTIHAEKGSITCKIRYVRFEVIEKAILDTLARISSSETEWQPIAKRIAEHNQKLDDKITTLLTQTTEQDEKMASLRDKKDKYLDSLLESRFTAQDRRRINDKITELEQEEKKIKAAITKYQLDQNLYADEKVNIAQFKKVLLGFQDVYTPKPLNLEAIREYLLRQVSEIKYYKAWFSIRFKLLPWPLDFDMLIPDEKEGS